MRKFVSAAVMVLSTNLLSGCANQAPVQHPPFPVDEYARLAKTGTGKIIGQFFASTVGGTVIHGTGT
ncbi:hypothetical protein ACLRDI_08460 [Pseudomonas piscis]|uniref:hypothetical protein n=1 Tax=Pseudomonas piscis TaxID=2614538 RepID=UPI0039A6770C